MVDDIEEDEGILDDDDEEKALVEQEQNIEDDNTLDTTTNNTTENTTTTIINDSDPGSQWKAERWHQENDDTSKRSSDTSIISHQSVGGSGSGTKVLIVSHDEIIVEINGQHGSNENSDIEIDTNGDSLQDDDEDEEANSEHKLLQTCNNKNELIAVKIPAEVKTLHNGVGINGFDGFCLTINQMGW